MNLTPDKKAACLKYLPMFGNEKKQIILWYLIIGNQNQPIRIVYIACKQKIHEFVNLWNLLMDISKSQKLKTLFTAKKNPITLSFSESYMYMYFSENKEFVILECSLLCKHLDIMPYLAIHLWFFSSFQSNRNSFTHREIKSSKRVLIHHRCTLELVHNEVK